jgi:hypothetical protein
MMKNARHPYPTLPLTSPPASPGGPRCCRLHFFCRGLGRIALVAVAFLLGLFSPATVGKAQSAEADASPVPGLATIPAPYRAVLSSLFEAVASDEPAVQAVALETTRSLLLSLQKSGDSGARAALRAMLGEAPAAAIQSQAAYILGILQDADAIADLRTAMAQGAREVRLSAAHALRGMGEPVESEIINPYAGVDWKRSGYYDANLHTHTNLSDGRYDPHYAIDKYHELNYDILALTDHDSMHHEVWPKALYPWTELNAIYHQIKDQRSSRFDRTYGELADEEWQNRDPEELGMVSIEGSEISRTHHTGSLFNDYAGGTRSEDTAFQEIAQRGGLAIFFHPGRYNRPTEWYVSHFQRHDHVVGMEVYNQADRYPVDRQKWDSVSYQLMPDRPVWGFANDDTHTDADFGRNRNVFLLPELKKERIFDAMKQGHFYFFVPVEQGVPPPVRLTGVEVTGDLIALEVAGDFDRIDWITYNPFTGESQTLAEGLEFSLEALVVPSPFVRAVVISPEGRTYTQPFGIQLQ